MTVLIRDSSHSIPDNLRHSRVSQTLLRIQLRSHFLILGVRLEGGSHREGRVEVYHNGRWGTVCDDGWDINDARVVCRQLGFPDAEAALKNSYFGRGTGAILLDDLRCEGNESSLFSCRHNGVGIHYGRHREDAGARCIDPEGENE